MSPSTIEPLSLDCLDGQERKFLVTLGTVRRIARAGVSEKTTEADFVITALHQSQVDSSLSEDDLAAVLPPDTKLLLNFWQALVKHCSSRGNEKYRPTMAGPEAMNGSSSHPSGESGSDSQ